MFPNWYAPINRRGNLGTTCFDMEREEACNFIKVFFLIKKSSNSTYDIETQGDSIWVKCFGRATHLI